MPRKNKRTRQGTENLAWYRERLKLTRMKDEARKKERDEHNARRKLEYHVKTKLLGEREQALSQDEVWSVTIRRTALKQTIHFVYQ